MSPAFYIRYRQNNLSIPNIKITFLSIPHKDKLYIPHMDKTFLSIFHIEHFSTCSIDKTFMYILGIDRLSILYIDMTSTYGVDKTKFLLHKGNSITSFNFINAVIHNNNSFHTIHIKD